MAPTPSSPTTKFSIGAIVFPSESFLHTKEMQIFGRKTHLVSEKPSRIMARRSFQQNQDEFKAIAKSLHLNEDCFSRVFTKDVAKIQCDGGNHAKISGTKPGTNTSASTPGTKPGLPLHIIVEPLQELGFAALDCYYKQISQMPSWSKLDWAGQYCACKSEFDHNSKVTNFSDGIVEDGIDIEGNVVEEMKNLDIQDGN
ncbi:hypothetical protein L1887_23626 [Cichorium endivia]|nr:hypothetical protein L1887_23626 [Cichorium endivia]